MKVILYIIALVTLAAGAFFVQKNIELHQKQLELTNELEIDNGNISAKITAIEGQLREANEKQAATTKEKNGRSGDLEVKEVNKKDLVRQSAGFDSQLTSLRDEQDEVDKVKERLQVIVEKENVPIEQVGQFIEDLEEDRKQLNKKHGELMAEVERYNGDVALNRTKISDFNSSQTKRRTSLKSNGVSSLITSVDNDWGFVVVKPHPDANISVDSKLIVVRGDRHVGRLSINAIEGGRVLANIDYSSIVAGMRIRPGDRVILSKVRTN